VREEEEVVTEELDGEDEETGAPGCCTGVERVDSVFPVPHCSVPHNLTGFRADGLWDVVTEVQLRTKDEETRRRRIASVNESGEEIRSLFVDGERLGLEYHLDRTIEDGEDDIGDGNS